MTTAQECAEMRRDALKTRIVDPLQVLALLDSYEAAYLRWKWNPEQKGDGALLLRGKAIPHSVMTPEGKYVHARDIAMNSWSFDRVLKFSNEPWKQIAPPEMQHWAILKSA
jgi:hypothetical protein